MPDVCLSVLPCEFYLFLMCFLASVVLEGVLAMVLIMLVSRMAVHVSGAFVSLTMFDLSVLCRELLGSFPGGRFLTLSEHLPSELMPLASGLLYLTLRRACGKAGKHGGRHTGGRTDRHANTQPGAQKCKPAGMGH